MKNYLLTWIARFQKSALGKDVLVTSFLSTVGRSLGLFIPLFIGAWFGTTSTTDAFFLAYGLLLFLTTMIGNIFETVVVPYVTDLRSRGEDVGSFMGSVMFRGSIFVLGIVLLLLLILKPVLELSTRLPAGTIELALTLTLEMILMIFLVTWTSALNGALNAYKAFHVAALFPVFRSAAILGIAFYFKKRWGIHAVALAFVLGEVLRLGLSLHYFRKIIGRIRWQWGNMREITPFFKSAFFQSMGLGFISLTSLIDQVMASWTGAGGLSIYTYAMRLYRIPFQMISTGPGSVVLSHWSHDYSAGRKAFLWPSVRRVVILFTLGMVIVSLAAFFLRDPIAALAFKRGEFPPENVPVVGSLFGLLMAGLPFQMVNLFCVRLLIIYQKNKFYMILGFIRLILDVLLNYLFMSIWGIQGIALATTVLNCLFALTFYLKVKHEASRQ